MSSLGDIQLDNVTWYFFHAWMNYEIAKSLVEAGDASKQYEWVLMKAETSLYQSAGLAGVHWPWGFTLPKP